MSTKFFQGKPCRKNHSGLRYHKSRACVECARENKRKHSEQRRQYRIRNQEKNRLYSRRYFQKRHGNLILDEIYNELMNDQKGRCAICGDNPRQKLSVDHCHNTGKIRGLLCRRCNLGLGCFDDKINILNQAISYLNKTGAV